MKGCKIGNDANDIKQETGQNAFIAGWSGQSFDDDYDVMKRSMSEWIASASASALVAGC